MEKKKEKELKLKKKNYQQLKKQNNYGKSYITLILE